MKNKKDFIFIIVFIVISGISLIYLFQTSYAKYRRQVNVNMTATIAKWDILVNEELINNKSELTGYITPVIDTNTHVKEGVLAPGGTGYFDVVIDATDVDVDFDYEITGAVNEATPLTDLKITRYVQDQTTYNYSSSTPISGTILKNTPNTTIRVYFEWDDSATNTMNNQDDTSYTINSSTHEAKIKVTLHFSQTQ